MAFIERAKSLFEWFEHGKTLWDIMGYVILSLGGGATIRAWVIQHTHTAPVWHTPIWLLSSGILFLLAVRFIPHVRGRVVQETAVQKKEATALIKTSVDLGRLEDIHKRLDLRLTEETEPEIKKALANLKGAEREQRLIRLLIATLWAATFDEIWHSIYGSQFRALTRLNRGPCARTALQVYYTSVLQKYPGIYATYSYDNWLEYLRANLLIKEQDGLVYVTIKGQGFLQQMTALGRTADERAY
jgi:hypothetical protein